MGLASWASSLHPRGFGGRFTRGAGQTQRHTRIAKRAIKRAHKQARRSARRDQTLGSDGNTRVSMATTQTRDIQRRANKATAAARRVTQREERDRRRREQPGRIRGFFARRKAQRADFARGYAQTPAERVIGQRLEAARQAEHTRVAAIKAAAKAAKAAKKAAPPAPPAKKAAPVKRVRKASKRAAPRKVVPRKAAKKVAAPVIRLRGGRAV
jgi:hypothetical protein